MVCWVFSKLVTTVSLTATPSLKCHLTFKIEDQERTRRYWKDLKIRPKRSKPPDSDIPSKKTKPIDCHTVKSLHRTGTLDPDEYDHPYLRVHYQRNVPSRVAAEQPWGESDPEFERFLAALSPLHRAAATGNVEKLDELLENEGDGDMECEFADTLYRHDRTGWDFTGAPPIHFAAYYGHHQAVLFLLSKGIRIDGKDAAGTTALHAAAWTGNEKLFKILLKKGADRTICDYDGWSVAIYAMSQGHDNISRLLLEGSGGDVETLVKTYTLRHAAKLGNMDTVLDMLLEDQAIGENSETRDMLFAEALIGAAEGGHEQLIQRLLEAGADPTASDNSGSTALHWAAWGGHTEIENLKHDEKADTTTAGGGTPTSPSHESVIQMLLDRGAAINAQNSQGCTPLHWVAGAGSAPMIRCFLDNGASVDIADNCGRTAVDRAVETKDEGVIRQLTGASV
jgi:ankyrin repeat protein